MKIVTQNLRHGGAERVKLLLDYILSIDPDMIILTEFQEQNLSGQLIKEALEKQHYFLAWSNDYKSNGVLIASRKEFLVEKNDSRKIQVYIEVYDLKVFGVYLPDQPGSEKNLYWQSVIDYADANKDNKTIIIGDFNSCLPSDSQNGTKYNAEDIKRLLQIGFFDAWENYRKDENRYTWWSNHGNGFRLDYMFLSSSIGKNISVRHENYTKKKIGENWLSDHCSLVAEINDFNIIGNK